MKNFVHWVELIIKFKVQEILKKDTETFLKLKQLNTNFVDNISILQLGQNKKKIIHTIIMKKLKTC